MIVDANNARTVPVPVRLWNVATPATTIDPTDYTVEAQLIDASSDSPASADWTSTGVAWNETPFNLRGAKGTVYAVVVKLNGAASTTLTAGETYKIAVKITAGSDSIILVCPTVFVAI